MFFCWGSLLSLGLQTGVIFFPKLLKPGLVCEAFARRVLFKTLDTVGFLDSSKPVSPGVGVCKDSWALFGQGVRGLLPLLVRKGSLCESSRRWHPVSSRPGRVPLDATGGL